MVLELVAAIIALLALIGLPVIAIGTAAD